MRISTLAFVSTLVNSHLLWTSSNFDDGQLVRVFDEQMDNDLKESEGNPRNYCNFIGCGSDDFFFFNI